MLPDVKKILYTSDIEMGSRPAFRSAVSLCGHYDSSIVFLHVIEPLSTNVANIIGNLVDQHDLDSAYQDSLAHLRETIAERVERFCQSELEQGELLKPGQIESRVEEGIVWKTILKVAEQMEADVIVMGRRKHRIAGLAMGSTAHKVLEHSTCPVLIVPLGDSK